MKEMLISEYDNTRGIKTITMICHRPVMVNKNEHFSVRLIVKVHTQSHKHKSAAVQSIIFSSSIYDLPFNFINGKYLVLKAWHQHLHAVFSFSSLGLSAVLLSSVFIVVPSHRSIGFFFNCRPFLFKGFKCLSLLYLTVLHLTVFFEPTVPHTPKSHQRWTKRSQGISLFNVGASLKN